jgi:hypothetical protein
MRKGGIEEETRDFQVKSNSFYLYPAYEHQKKELLKEEYRHQIDETLQRWNPEDVKTMITCYAELVEDIEIWEQDQIDRLYSFHIWTDRFTEERLRWKRKNPLHLMLLRLYKLEEPIEIEIRPEYNGCKSWIELQGNTVFPASKPVLDDVTFAETMAEIKEILRG